MPVRARRFATPMPIPARSLTAVLAVLLLACTGGGGEPSATAVADDQPASTAEATATPVDEATPSVSPSAAPLSRSGYAAALCERADRASMRSFDAFTAAADAFERAGGDAEGEAIAIAGWATESAGAWLEVAEWAATVEPPPVFADYHAAITEAAATTTLQRAELTDEIGAVTDPGEYWILVQRGWAAFQLEPLAFIPGARAALVTEQSFLARDCGPLFESIGTTTVIAPNTALSEYAAQICWLYALIWERQQLNLRDLALGLDPDLDLEASVLAGSIYARQEQRIQLMAGLGLQAIVPPPEAASFHEAVFGNSADRLVAVFRAEVTLEDAIAGDEVDLALNGLLNDAFALAEELMLIRDAAAATIQEELVASEPCGALDGSEVAFYRALAG